MAPPPDPEKAHEDGVMCQKIVQHHVFFTPKEGEGWESCAELPTAKEILEQQQNTEGLPHNPVDKPWDSKSDYLAAQYKILRREGTEGLRFSVRSYIDACAVGQEMMDNQHTAIYVGVHVKCYLMSRLGAIARIQFSTARSPLQIKWQQSRRLIPGTIVALTTKDDNFKTICKIATIAQRPYADGLDQNPPLVDLLWADPRDSVFDPSIEMVMIESRDGYFESARHTLIGLQHVAQGSSPLDKYITGAQTADKAPEFVQQSPFMDLSSLVHNIPQDEGRTYKDITDPLKDHDVLTGLPDLDGLTTLDQSQLRGLHRILSTELAIVQGPPGTGKTFTSVEALKVMVATRQKYGGPPIMVSAQTNHALDQLLSHCLGFGASICRVGSRTESEVIRAFTVYEIRSRQGSSRDQRYKNLYQSRINIERKVRDLVDSVFGDHLLNRHALLEAGIITQKQCDSLYDDTMETGERTKALGPFALWLGDNLIPAAIVEDKYPTRQEVDEAAEKLMADWEFDGDLENIAEDEEDAFRIEGELVFLRHVWSGKEPGFLRKWERRVVRELAECQDMFDIEPSLRGGVYQYLQRKLVQALTPKFAALLVEYRNICNSMKAHRWYKDAQMLEKLEVDVVGCTTTGLAKYRGLLAGLRPFSLLIEEAAETREANITSAIYPTLQQLILVGDHQQLAPRCDIRWLGDEPFNLNVSMFQRMVNLNMPFVMLNEQRRMKPEIRRIVSPFYPDLVDHPDVLVESLRPDVPGMGGRNSWCFNHCWPENINSEQSKYNETEADMVVKFFAYLVANGTDPTQITVLTFYKGQRKLLLNKLKKEGSMRLPVNTFRVHTVDSYQGEENDIVILSLVRSPLTGIAVGFLDDQRRAVVAISRARRGFYVFGNIQNLLNAHWECRLLWGNIWNGFAEQGRVKMALGLPLICQQHGNEIWVKDVEDWGDNAGGCNQQCQEMRPCGHACTLKCHFTDHERLPCSAPCRNTLECGHGCEKFCGKVCYCSCNKFRNILIARETEKGRLAKIEDQQDQELGMSLEQKLALEMPGVAFLKFAADRADSGIPSKLPGGGRSPDLLSPLAAERNETSPENWIGTTSEQWNESSPEKWQEFTANIKEHDAKIHLESRRRVISAGDTANKMMISDTYNAVDLVDGRRTTNKPRSTQKLEVPFHKKSSPGTGAAQRGQFHHSRGGRRAPKPVKKSFGKKSPGKKPPVKKSPGKKSPNAASGGKSVEKQNNPNVENRVSGESSSKEENLLLSLEEIDLLAGPLDLLTGNHGEAAGNGLVKSALPLPDAKPKPAAMSDLLIDFSDLEM